MPKVTIFPNAKNPNNPYIIDSQQVVELIRSGKWADKVEKLNSFPRGSAEQGEFKRTQLPAVAWQGEFTYRNESGILTHSGLVAVDIDNLPPDEMERYIKMLTANKYTHILFRSPRMNGLKVIIRIPADIEHHKEYVGAIGDQYRKHAPKYYDHYDDLARLCFVSHDPDIYYNPDSEVFTSKAKIKKPTQGQPSTAHVPENIVSTFNRVRAWADKGSTYADSNKHCHLIRLFTACNRYGIPPDQAATLAYNHYGNMQGCEPVRLSDFENRADSVYRLYSEQNGTAKFDESTPVIIIPPPHEDPPEDPNVKGRFPIEVFPGAIPSFIKALNESLNYSHDFTSIAIMFTMATINGNKVKLRVKPEWNAPTIFWFAAVGEPGTMKSHPIRTILDPIKHIDSESKKFYDQQYEEYEHELAEAKGKNKVSVRKPNFRQILISDITLESLHEVHDHNKRGLGLYRDELVGFLFDMNRYRSGSDEQFWLESFNNGSYTVNRVSKRPSIVEDTNINIIGTIQPSVFSKVSRDNSGNGLVDRFLYTTSERSIYPMTLNTLDEGWIKWWRESIININRTFDYLDKVDGVLIDMTPAAAQKIIEVDTRVCDMQKSDDLTDALKNYLNKYKTYMPRFTLLMALMDHCFESKELIVEPHHVERADRIMQYFFDSARTIFSEAERSTEMKNVINMNVKKGMTKYEQILHLHAKGYKNADIARMVNVTRVYVGKTLNDKPGASK